MRHGGVGRGIERGIERGIRGAWRGRNAAVMQDQIRLHGTYHVGKVQLLGTFP